LEHVCDIVEKMVMRKQRETDPSENEISVKLSLLGKRVKEKQVFWEN